MFEFPIALSVLDFLLLIAILISSAWIALKSNGMVRVITSLVALGIFSVLAFAPLRLDAESLMAISALGLWAVPVLWAIMVVSPPYPDNELMIIIPLKIFLGVPTWIGELIAQGLALMILYLTSSQFTLVWSIIARNFVSPLILVVSIFWLLLFLGVSRYGLGEW